MKTHILSLAFAAALIATPAIAREYAAIPGPDFAKIVAGSDDYEIATSRLAMKRSHNAAVRNIAQHMIADHTHSSAVLKSVLVSENIDVAPARLDAEHQQKFDDLKATSAKNFDYQYLADQLAAHRQAIGLFQTYYRSGTDAGLRNFAGKTLPTLHHHEDMVNKQLMKMPHGW